MENKEKLDPMDAWWKKKKESFFIWVLLASLPLAGGIWHFVQAPLQAQIIEDMKIISEMPVVKAKLDGVEGAMLEIKIEHQEFRKVLNENNRLLRELLKSRVR